MQCVCCPPFIFNFYAIFASFFFSFLVVNTGIIGKTSVEAFCQPSGHHYNNDFLFTPAVFPKTI